MQCPICNDTLVTPKLSPGCLTHQHQTRCPFVWNDLTEEQMDVLRDAALGRAVRKEIASLENKREQGDILSDTEDDWLNGLQGFVAGLMEVEK